MDDILLTLTEIARAQDEGVLAFHRAGGADGDLEQGDYVNRYVCRAQVAKVVKWIETDPKAVIGTRALQALRAAAGMEGGG